MIKKTVHFEAITDIYDFVAIVTKHPYEVDLTSGRYVIDAKSIMGIFSLNLLSNIDLIIHADKADDLLKEIDKYLVK